MLTPVPPTDCMLARESASVRLDGELTELEVARLDAHLRVCADCRAYSLEIGEITNRLQAAKLEQPGQALVLPRRRRLAGARMQAVLAAAAVVVVAATAAASSFTIGHALRTRTDAPPGHEHAVGRGVDAAGHPAGARPRALDPSPDSDDAARRQHVRGLIRTRLAFPQTSN